MVVNRLAESLSLLLPGELAEDIKHNISSAVASALDRMNLVTREELEVQEAVLMRTREKVEQLEARLAEYEKALKSKEGDE